MRSRIRQPLRLVARLLVMLVAAGAGALTVAAPAQAAATVYPGHTSYWRYLTSQQMSFGIGTNEVEMEGWGTDDNGTRTLFGTITVANGICAGVKMPAGMGGAMIISSVCSGTSPVFAFPVSTGQMLIYIEAAPARGGWLDRNNVVLPASTTNLRRAGTAIERADTANAKTFSIAMRGMSMHGSVSGGVIALWVYHTTSTGCARGDVTDVFKNLRVRAQNCDGRIATAQVADNGSGIVVFASYIPPVLPAHTLMLQVA